MKTILLFFLLFVFCCCIPLTIADFDNRYYDGFDSSGTIDATKWNQGTGSTLATVTGDQFQDGNQSADIYTQYSQRIYSNGSNGSQYSILTTGQYVLSFWLRTDASSFNDAASLDFQNSTNNNCFQIEPGYPSANNWGYYVSGWVNTGVAANTGRGSIANSWMQLRVLIDNDNGRFSLRFGNTTTDDVTNITSGCGITARIQLLGIVNAMSDNHIYLDNVSMWNYTTYGWETPGSPCVENWTCNDYAACLPNNTQTCNDYEDLNVCNVTYSGGGISQSCNYTAPQGIFTEPARYTGQYYIFSDSAFSFTVEVEDNTTIEWCALYFNASFITNLTFFTGSGETFDLNDTFSALDPLNNNTLFYHPSILCADSYGIEASSDDFYPANAYENNWTFTVLNCFQNWVCDDYGDCLNNSQNCTSATDTNGCGAAYGGDYSEFPPQSCGTAPATVTEIVTSIIGFALFAIIIVIFLDGLLTKKSEELNNLFRIVYIVLGVIVLVALTLFMVL